nr:MAG TPA: hypothetical protein [Caudoviricetes sp.]DAQ00158.1 MAG TPA: hypothetical protein [Caudoviricetes sp.]DAU10964.1 MAG TPA: hypothetical protein [Caudoviricetes sp.]
MCLYSFSNWWHLFKCYLNCFFRVQLTEFRVD